MYIVSCRREFNSDRFFAAEPLVRNYIDPTNLDRFQVSSIQALAEQVEGRHAVVLVHGFNNSLESVFHAYWGTVSQMQAAALTSPSAYGLVVGFAWPGFSTSAGYFPARMTARRAGSYLHTLVSALRRSALTVDIQTHSLGARVALTSLLKPGIFADNLFMLAPAVDNNLLEPGEDFHPALESANRVFVYHSRRDPVLRSAYLLGDAADGIRPALGLRGPRRKEITLKKCSNVYVLDSTSAVGASHSGYRTTPGYYKHWLSALSGEPLPRYDELS